MRRTAAVDYGRRRIGLAISDPLGITVRGLDTYFWGGSEGPPEEASGEALTGPARSAVADVARILQEAGAGLIVVGLPLHASGEESEMSHEARRFGRALAEASGVEVVYIDEGLTSWEAEESLKKRRRPLRQAQQRGDVDREAAMGILRSWLEEFGN